MIAPIQDADEEENMPVLWRGEEEPQETQEPKL